MYTNQFATATNPIRTTLLYFDPTSATEVHYGCLDAIRANQLIDYATSLGLPIPGWLIKFVTPILNLVHVDGIIVFSGSGSNIGAGVTTAITNILSAAPLKYSLSTDATYYSTC